jgi:hypothetical protein
MSGKLTELTECLYEAEKNPESILVLDPSIHFIIFRITIFQKLQLAKLYPSLITVTIILNLSTAFMM